MTKKQFNQLVKDLAECEKESENAIRHKYFNRCTDEGFEKTMKRFGA